MSLQRVPIKNFRGGLNTRDSPFELMENESPDLQNVTISALVGQLEQRKGKTRFDLEGLPEGEPVDYMKQVTVGTNASLLMLSINGGVYYSNGEGKVKKLFKGTAGTIWTFEVFSDLAFKDWVYMGNGVDAMQKWDGEAAATVEWVTEKGALPKGSILKVWENRMCIAGVAATPQRMFFSEFGDPQAGVKEYGFVDVRGTEEDLDAVQDLAVLGARLFVLKRRSVFFVSSAVTFLNRRVGGPGVWGRFQTIELEDKLYFFNPQGIFSTAGVTVTMESGSINNYFPNHVTNTAFDKVRMIATKDTYPRLLLAMPVDGSTTNNKLIEMVPHINFRRIGGRRYLLLPAFMLHTVPSSALACFNPTGHSEVIICSGSSNSTAGKTTFPNLLISDGFHRPFEGPPLNNGGAWAPFWQAGLKLGEFGVFPEKRGVICTQRFASSGEITNPAVEVEATNAEILEKGQVHEVFLFSCLKPEEPFNNGYKAILKCSQSETGENTCELYVEKNVGGITELLLKKVLGPCGFNLRFGMTVLEGKIKLWWNLAGKGWELIGEVADATFTKGYSGMGAYGSVVGAASIRLNNFRTANIPAVTRRLSNLFAGNTDEGEEISSYWHSSWFAIQAEEPKERMRRLNIELQGDAVLDVFTDFSALPLFSQSVPKSGGEGSEYRFARVRPETRGRFHSVKIRSLPGGQPFLVNAMEMVVRGGKEH